MEQQYAELAEFLNDPKVTVRKEALMTILQFAQTKEARANFIGSNLVKYTIKLLGDEECQQSLISVIIQFSLDEVFSKQLIELGAVIRVAELIKEKVLDYYKSKQINEQNVLYIKLGLLALNNLTQTQEGQNKFLQLDQEGINRCFYYRLFCNFFTDDRSIDMFSDFQSLLINVTSSEEVRMQLLNNDMQMIGFFVKLLSTTDLFAIQIVKNMLFEYEQPEMLKQIQTLSIVDNVIEFLAKDIVLNHAQFDVPQNDLAYQLAVIHKPLPNDPQYYMQRTTEALKCLLILTNIDPKETPLVYNKQRLDLVMRQLRKLKGLDQDQMDVVETVYLKL